MFSHWVSDRKSPQVSMTLLSNLADLNKGWSLLVLLFPSLPIPLSIEWYDRHLMFHCFFQFSGKFLVLSFLFGFFYHLFSLSLSLIFTLSKFGWLIFFINYYEIWSSETKTRYFSKLQFLEDNVIFAFFMVKRIHIKSMFTFVCLDAYKHTAYIFCGTF